MTITERLRQLSKAVSEERFGEFSMRVPAEPDRDADFVLKNAADLLESLYRRNDELVTGLGACDEHVVSLQHIIDEEAKDSAQVIIERDKLHKQLETARIALQKLSCLGNGDQPGNSIGNCIAQDALLEIWANQ